MLIITPDFPPAHGGAQVLAHRLAAGMTRLERLTLTLDGPGAALFDEHSDLRVRRVGADRAPRAARNALLNCSALAAAPRFRPDVVLSLHIVTSPAAALLRRTRRIPVAQYFYAKEIPPRRRLAAFAVEHADAAIAISAYCAQLLAASGAAPRRLQLIPPGVDIPSDPAPLPAARPTIVTIARLDDRYKGHDVMLLALARVREAVPEVQWVVIGEGSLRESLEAQARAEGVSESVLFLGAVADLERDRWLRAADVLAMPSRVPEDGSAGDGFGIVFLEAAAHGKPVVAGNAGGAQDAVSDGETGMLVDARDPRAVAEALSRLLLDRALAARLGAAGAARAQRFAWPLIARRVEDLLLELASG